MSPKTGVDYHPFGMMMGGRSWSQSTNYRYGFQGQEQDQEFYDGAVSYRYRVHDPRIGRFLSIDPLAPEYPWNSPYAFSENRVIDGLELEGREWQPVNDCFENVENNSEEHTGYTWTGYDSGGNPLEGTVSEGMIMAENGNSAVFYSVNELTNGPQVGFEELTDQHTLNRISELHPRARKTFKEFLLRVQYEHDVTFRLGEPVLRTIDEQNELYSRSRTQEQLNNVGLNNVVAQPDEPWATNARGGFSYHNYGLAGDFYRLLDDGSIQWDYDRSPLSEIANSLGLTWLGPAFDPPHYQMTFGLSVQELLELYNNGDVDDDGYVEIPENE